MKTQTMPIPAKSELVPAKLYVRTKTVKSEINLNDIDVMTPELDYMPDAKADLILIAAVIVLGLLAVASWIWG